MLNNFGYSFYSLESGALIPRASCPLHGNIWAIHQDE
jgi:hypothetical protein